MASKDGCRFLTMCDLIEARSAEKNKKKNRTFSTTFMRNISKTPQSNDQGKTIDMF